MPSKLSCCSIKCSCRLNDFSQGGAPNLLRLVNYSMSKLYFPFQGPTDTIYCTCMLHQAPWQVIYMLLIFIDICTTGVPVHPHLADLETESMVGRILRWPKDCGSLVATTHTISQVCYQSWYCSEGTFRCN